MFRRGRRPFVAALALSSVLSTGCAVTVTGEPTAAAGSAPTSRSFEDADRLHASDALGDLTTWNPCSVVSPEDLPESWDVELDVPVAYEDCRLSVITDDGLGAEVQVGYLYRSTHDVAQHKSGARPGGLTIVPFDTDDGSCARDVVFADDIAIEVLSWPEDPDDVDASCALSDTVAEQVVEAVLDGRAETLTLPKNSIGEIDACSVVTSTVAASVPGITADVPAVPQLHRHSCWWEGPDGATLNVEFEIGRMPTGDTSTTTHGRRTAVTRYPDDETTSLCVVDGEHVPFEHDTETGLVERVGIYVYLPPGQVEAACTAGSAVAEALWQELPPL